MAGETNGLRRFDKVSFYFAAHPDDWQLFMTPSAFEDVLAARTKAVFVHVTAGDAGLGAGTGGRRQPYYLARENGSNVAIRFMADADAPPVEATVSRPRFNGHEIRRIGYRNTEAYFLRLPDGGGAGAGYAETGSQSLTRLAEGRIDHLSAIDGSTSYASWSDLVTTMRDLFRVEGGDAALEFHVPDPDTARNPEDHPDHLMSGRAGLDAARGFAARRVLHVGYASARRPENLFSEQRDMKCAVYAVTLSGLLACDHAIAWRHYDRLYVGRNYFRVEDGAA
jgi:LmbE family N-acetylglucosaminyl deacetylase